MRVLLHKSERAVGDDGVLGLPLSVGTGDDYTMVQVRSTEKGFIYALTWNEDGSVHGYEVFCRRVAGQSVVFGKSVPAHLRYPSDEDFGTWAWSVKGLERAEQVLSEIDAGIRPYPAGER